MFRTGLTEDNIYRRVLAQSPLGFPNMVLVPRIGGHQASEVSVFIGKARFNIVTLFPSNVLPVDGSAPVFGE